MNGTTDTALAEQKMKAMMRSLLPDIDGVDDVLESGLPEAYVRSLTAGGSMATLDALFLLVLLLASFLTAHDDEPVNTSVALVESAFSGDRTRPLLELLSKQTREAMEASNG